MRTTASTRKLPERTIRPIRTEADHKAALAEIERLWDAKPGTPEADRMEVLVTLVDDYEDEHFPVGEVDPVEAIKFRMEQAGLTRRDLEPILGGRNRVSEVLNRKRGLSLEMIRALHRKLGIPLESLIQETRRAAQVGGTRRPRLWDR